MQIAMHIHVVILCPWLYNNTFNICMFCLPLDIVGFVFPEWIPTLRPLWNKLYFPLLHCRRMHYKNYKKWTGTPGGQKGKEGRFLHLHACELFIDIYPGKYFTWKWTLMLKTIFNNFRCNTSILDRIKKTGQGPEWALAENLYIFVAR